jgi:hypothetical protein
MALLFRGMPVGGIARLLMIVVDSMCSSVAPVVFTAMDSAMPVLLANTL